MKVLVARRQAPAAPRPITVTGRGPRVLAVAGAAGGAGASTLCALLASATIELTALNGHRVAILDGSEGPASPWPDWISPGADEALGEEGLSALDLGGVPGSRFTRAQLLRCAGSIRGLAGVAVLTGSAPLSARRKLTPLARAFAVAVQDLTSSPSEAAVVELLAADHALVLAISGTADGVAAGIRATRSWAGFGLPPTRVLPVVIAGSVGGLSPRARSRLTLLDANTQPALVVPFDPAIARRGLAEALACGAVGAPTRLAARRVVSALLTPSAADTPNSDDLALFPAAVPAPTSSSTSAAYEGAI